MHDGYLFTLGVCGGASASGPAPACLDQMLAALPPVKRAAYLGEVLVSEGAPSFDDPLLAPILADSADAEILLLSIPLPGGSLPPRIAALARALEAAVPPPRRRFAALVAFADGATTALWPLRHALDAAGYELLAEIYAPLDAAAAAVADEAVALAREAYTRARALNPEALP